MHTFRINVPLASTYVNYAFWLPRLKNPWGITSNFLTNRSCAIGSYDAKGFHCSLPKDKWKLIMEHTDLFDAQISLTHRSLWHSGSSINLFNASTSSLHCLFNASPLQHINLINMFDTRSALKSSVWSVLKIHARSALKTNAWSVRKSNV